MDWVEAKKESNRSVERSSVLEVVGWVRGTSYPTPNQEGTVGVPLRGGRLLDTLALVSGAQ